MVNKRNTMYLFDSMYYSGDFKRVYFLLLAIIQLLGGIIYNT